MRQNRLKITFDEDFEGVIKACAGPREGKAALTWITPSIMHAFAGLSDAGHAHSFEVCTENGTLVGGGYGVAVGNVFVIESQFACEPGASQIGLAVLAAHLAQWGFVLLDNKVMTPTVERMASVTSEGQYLENLQAVPSTKLVRRWRAVLDSRQAEAALRGGAGHPEGQPRVSMA
jgi:leucyl/phenylalanyl-tRNA--protein transferase